MRISHVAAVLVLWPWLAFGSFLYFRAVEGEKVMAMAWWATQAGGIAGLAGTALWRRALPERPAGWRGSPLLFLASLVPPAIAVALLFR